MKKRTKLGSDEVEHGSGGGGWGRKRALMRGVLVGDLKAGKGVRAFPSVIMNKSAMMALDRSSELRR